MTTPPDPVAERPPERGIGGGRKRRKIQAPPRKDGNGLLIVGLLSALALVVGGFALYLIATRPATPAAASTASCRTIAWESLPDNDALPEGWTVTGSGFYTDGYGASFSGPVASGSPAPVINVRVSCYGSDGHLAVTRSHDADLAVGGTDVPFADVGDEALATKDRTGTTTSVYVRRGQLVASIASQGVSADDLEEAAGAIDDAMDTAESAVAEASPGAEPNASDEGEVPTDELGTDVPDETPTHTFPELEAILPKTVEGAPFVSESTTATEVMSGDPSGEALFQWLTQNGKTSDQLEFADSSDPTGTVDADFTALRVDGIAAAKLRAELIATWLSADTTGVTPVNKTIGGKPVQVIDYGDGGSIDYVFDQGDAVIVLSSSDPAVVEKVLAGFK